MDAMTEILKSLPLTVLEPNAAGTAYVDMTGRGVTLSATPTLVTPINSGSTRAMLVGTTGVNFSSGVFIRGQEKRSFTLEATVLPTDTLSGSQTILSHVSAYDGLAIINRELRFTIEFNTLGNVYVAYPIPDNYETMTVIGAYTPGAIKLYVNGDLAGSAEVSAAQIKDGFKNRANNNLYIGVATGSQIILVDCPAIYSRSLSDAEAYMHYIASIRVIPEEEVTESLRPVKFDGTGRNIYSTEEWTGNDFQDGIHTNTTYNETGLIPQIDYVTQLSKASTWIGTFEMPAATDVPKIYGIKVEYQGVGSYTASFSKDNGTTWLTPANFTELAGTFDWAPTGQPILARIVFAGGIANDPAVVTRVSLTAYMSPTLTGTDSGRSIALASGNTTSDDKEEPIINERYNGIVNGGAAFVMSGDTDIDDPQPVIALETWFTFESTLTNAYVFDNRPGGGTHYLWSTGGKFAFPAGGVLYVNGVNVATAVADTRLGVPNHILYVFPASFNTPISFPPTPKNFEFIKTYAIAPTAADAARIYSAYVGYPNARLITESNPVTEGGSAYKTYAYDWSVTQAG
jgi:hypothetical protein